MTKKIKKSYYASLKSSIKSEIYAYNVYDKLAKGAISKIYLHGIIKGMELAGCNTTGLEKRILKEIGDTRK